MLPQELRIGNYVDEAYVVYQVNQIDCTTKHKLIGINDPDNSLCPPDTLKPIPLTEEWLINLGFDFYKPLSHYRIVIDGVWYSISVNYKGLEGFWFTFVNLNADEVNHMPYQRVKHIHELQNLYYALTKEELILSKD